MNDRRQWLALAHMDQLLQGPMFLLTLLWLAILLLELTGNAGSFLLGVGTAIWVLFLFEFAARFAIAPNKGAFLKRNWITAIALILPALRLFRMLRVLRSMRALRGLRLARTVGSLNRGMRTLRASMRRKGANFVLTLTLLVLLIGAGGMLNFEPASEVPGGFRSYGHALWWTGMLIASLGTDFWPQTTEGRVLSAILALYGLGVFGYVTATFATLLLGREASDGRIAAQGSEALRDLQSEVNRLAGVVEQLVLERTTRLTPPHSRKIPRDREGGD